MKFAARRFNIYYLALAAVTLTGGCGSPGLDFKKNEYSTIRLYLEGPKADPSGVTTVNVTRMNIPMSLNKEPFLTEEDITGAALVDNPDGTYAIQVNFTRHGSLVLDMTTTASRGKHIAVLCHFPPKGWSPPKEGTAAAKTIDAPAGQARMSAWLSAVPIHDRMSGGAFTFTPDASHEEAARIVRGLNNIVADMKKMGGLNE